MTKADAALVGRLHPALQQWVTGRFTHLTDIQRLALPHVFRGENTLILAPTGSGKTLSAFLSCLSELAREAAAGTLPNATRVVYVSPLRSLDRDIHRNLTGPLEAINATLEEKRQIRMEVRTGDTAAEARSKMQRRRPHLLLTTVESLSALLSQVSWQEGLQTRVVVVDEVHAFAESKRGSLLSLTLERLDRRSPGGLQRIGLSATAHPISAVQSLLCGERPCAVAQVAVQKVFELDIAVPRRAPYLPPAGYNTYRVAHVVDELVHSAQCSLVFTSVRSGAERIGLALKLLHPDEEDLYDVHHGSIARDRREEIEQALADGKMRAVACSSSLELGVDFAAVDQVVMIGTPRGVSRTLQRMGRSGRRIDGKAKGVLVPLNTLDLVECIALREAAHQGKLDELRPPRAPLDVLAQVLLGMAVERDWGLDEAYELVRCAGPYRGLRRDQFDLVIDYLRGGGKVLGPYGTYGKIVEYNGQFTVASRKIARDYYMNIGTISDDFAVRVVNQRGAHLGSVQDSYLSSLKPDEAFLVGGKPVVLERMMGSTAVVRPATGERVSTPRWTGNKMSMTAQLAAEELRLRRALRLAWEHGGREAARDLLRREYHVVGHVAEPVLRFLDRQNRAAPIPIDSPVQVEIVPDGRSRVVQFHILAGTGVNRSLSWCVGHRLGAGHSVMGNFDDHSFLLTFSAKAVPGEDRLRAAFDPHHFLDDLQRFVQTTETLGYGFRNVAETGQLLPRRTWQGRVAPKAQSWNGNLLYSTLLKYEPEHPLVAETVREVIEDRMDGQRAQQEAARIHASPWEVFRHPRPSPFALPLYAAFNREVLIAQDPERALDEYVEQLFADWDEAEIHEPVA